MAVVLLQPYQGSQHDTERALRALLSDKTIIGLAYIAMRLERQYSVGVAGETKLAPTITRGMLCLLDDELARLIREPRR